MAANLRVNWWVSLRNPSEIWEKHPSFLVSEISFYLFGILTLKHALKAGGRYPYLWLSTILHGLTVEILSYFLSDINSFWHAQSMVMLVGCRLPFHIVFAYAALIYPASVAVSRLHLRKWAEPFAVGIAVLLFDIPFDIMGIKLLWWTWHDTDPNVFDRNYWVAWTSYYFHAAFTSSFTIIFHNSRHLISDKDKFVADGFLKEMICCLLTGLFSMPLGTLQFLPVYHTLHDNFRIHTEVCVFLLIGLYVLLWWTSDRNPEREARTLPNKGWFDEIYLTIFLHYMAYILLVFFEKPENNVSIGLHEPAGNCNATSPVRTAFGQDLKWWFAFRHPKEIWEKHPSFLIAEISFYLYALLTLRHALRSGGRFPYLWISTIFHGLTVESLSYFLPDIDNFWHAQSMVMLLGKRLPFHIMVLYAAFIYTASVAVSRLHLKRWAEPFAVGLAVVLFDIPFDIMGIKLLWWTWHDTDPNIFDRHYWVPWTSYYFHAAFASSFTIIFHNSRRLLSDREKMQADSFLKEMICCLLTGLFSMPLGTLQFLPVYHTLHDNFRVHTEVCVFLLIGLYVLLWWTSDRNPEREARTVPNKGWFDEIYLTIFLHYMTYILLVFFEKPENNVSIGLHEPAGNCNATSPVMTATGQILSKKTYLCVSDYDEGYYDFHCTKPPKEGEDWYTVCGMAFENVVEYRVVVTAFCLLGLTVYTQMLAYSGRQPKTRAPRPLTPKAKRN